MKQQIEVPGDWPGVAALMEFCDAVEQRLPLTADQSYLMRLAVEEIATNIVKYGYGDAARGVIQVSCAVDDGNLQVSIRDRGQPFDPRDHAPPDFSVPAAERDIGGLGLFFVRELADRLSYHHDPASGWNELIVTRGP
jgi:anti-sigma regulatory factor (Ser/Thr protein kinase)